MKLRQIVLTVGEIAMASLLLGFLANGVSSQRKSDGHDTQGDRINNLFDLHQIDSNRKHVEGNIPKERVNNIFDLGQIDSDRKHVEGNIPRERDVHVDTGTTHNPQPSASPSGSPTTATSSRTSSPILTPVLPITPSPTPAPIQLTFRVTSLDDIFSAELTVQNALLPRTYILPPGTTFAVSTEYNSDGSPVDGQYPLVLTNSNVKVKCGDDGVSGNGCIIKGGIYQTLIKGNVNNVVIQGMTFSQGNLNSNAVDARGDVLFQDCVFTGFNTQYMMYTRLGEITRFRRTQGKILEELTESIQRVVEERDSVDYSLSDELTVVFDGCAFNNNEESSAPDFGAVIFNLDATVVVKNSIFDNNTNKWAILNSGAVALIGNCFLDDFLSSQGEVYIESGGMLLPHTTSNYVDHAIREIGWGNCHFVSFETGRCVENDMASCPLLGVSTPVPTQTPPQTDSSATTFDITFDFVNNNPNLYTEDWTVAFTAAATKWESIIVGDLSGFEGSLLQKKTPTCTALPDYIDDLYVCAYDRHIDGTANIVGAAHPVWLRSDTRIPVSGVIYFDQADIQRLITRGMLDDVVLHEIAHVLGFGFFESMGLAYNLGNNNDGNDWQYNGTNACAQWASHEGCTGCPPMENTGGFGTAGAHWDETVLSTELMTGFVGSTSANPAISNITVGAFEDIGYVVDYSAANAIASPCQNRKLGKSNRHRRLKPELEAHAIKYGNTILRRNSGKRRARDPDGLVYIGDRSLLVLVEDESGEIFAVDVSREGT